MMEDKKDTSTTGAAATEDVEVVDIEDTVETSSDVPDEIDASTSDHTSEEGSEPSEETFGEADILAEPEDAPNIDSSAIHTL